MKLRVVAWCNYDEDLPCGDNGWAAHNAIIDDIRANDYDFLGWHHVESSYCTPVLNDGKKYCFSQQGWSDLMTEAHRFYGETDYADYYIPDEIDEMAMLSSKQSRRPKQYYHGKVTAETDLNETFELQVTQRKFNSAAKNGKLRFRDFYRAINEGEITPDLENLRHIYNGDTLTLVCGDKRETYTVTSAERQHIADSRKYQQLRPQILSDDRRTSKRASTLYNLYTLTLVIKLKKQEHNAPRD